MSKPLAIRGVAHPPPRRDGGRSNLADLSRAEIQSTDLAGKPLLNEHDASERVGTVLVYLNDVEDGGCTRFNKLGITVAPKKGDACLFFPADASGQFDERMEHEGEAPRAEKWIGRIWVHARPIIGETGCPPGTLEALRNR